MRTLYLQIVSWLLICLANHSIATNKLNQGDEFNSSTRLISTNGLFTLRFSGKYLVINYTKDDTFAHPVWSANRDDPISEECSGALTIDEFGSLKIIHHGGDPIVIYQGDSKSNGSGVTVVLEDNGNLVVKKRGHVVLWESFDHPTDTLLPGMKLGINRRSGKKWKLTAGSSQNSPTSGPLTLEWDPEKRQVFVKLRGERFWSSGVLSTPDNKFKNLYSDDYNFSHVSNEDEDYITYEGSLPPYPEYIPTRNISRLVFRYSGNLMQYGPSFRSLLSACFSCCDGNSTRRGCQKWENRMMCRRNGDRFVYRASYFQAENFSYNKSLSFMDCKYKCWKNCSCTAVNYDEDYGCEFYTGSYAGKGILSPADPYTVPALMYIIVHDHTPSRASKKWIWIVTSVTLYPTVILAALYWYWRWRNLKQEEKFMRELLTWDRPQNETNEVEDDGDRNRTLKVYSFASIKSATNSFSSENKLGEGGFGPVYKGRSAEGAEIAVKRLSRRSGQGLAEFKNELLFIAKLQHMNLVRLLGFCIQGGERLLVYEYLPNKSLDSYIFGDESKREVLDWNKRFNIIEGIAQGLLYLHKYSRLRIIHRDLKASNVLLDKDMNPKISDFGMARIFRANESEANTNRIVGTYGYMPPEYAMNGIFSVKSDVYSFGVLVLEIVSGKRNHNVCMLNQLIHYAWDLWKMDKALELVDPAIRETAAKDQVLTCINVGLLCVEQSPFDRPTMSNALSMLTSEVKLELPIPKQPALCIGETHPTSMSSIVEQNLLANGLSITEMDGR